MLVKESNYLRKAQRITLPLIVKINNIAYKVKEWSIIGLSILDLDDELKNYKELECNLILPLEGAQFVLPTKIVIKNSRKNLTGCEFKDLSPKNKRILRRFIELSIEGGLGNIEDFIAAYSEPVIETPIEEALSLKENEARQIKKDFIKKSIFYIFVGLLLSILISYTIMYNFRYKIISTGIVTGNFVKITSNYKGIIDKIYVENNEEVYKGLVLFDLIVKENVKEYISEDDSHKNIDIKNKNDSRYNVKIVKYLKERRDNKKRELENAKELYSKRLITIKDYNTIHNNFIKSSLAYEDALEDMRKENLKQQTVVKKKGRYEIVLESKIKRRISSINGYVYNIEKHEDEFVNESEVVMLIKTTKKPFVLSKMSSRDILNIKINDVVLIASPYQTGYYLGKIRQIGYAAVNANTSISQEGSLNESLVKIEFDARDIDLPLNSRVEIKIKRNFFNSNEKKI